MKKSLICGALAASLALGGLGASGAFQPAPAPKLANAVLVRYRVYRPRTSYYYRYHWYRPSHRYYYRHWHHHYYH